MQYACIAELRCSKLLTSLKLAMLNEPIDSRRYNSIECWDDKLSLASGQASPEISIIQQKQTNKLENTRQSYSSSKIRFFCIFADERNNRANCYDFCIAVSQLRAVAGLRWAKKSEQQLFHAVII